MYQVRVKHQPNPHHHYQCASFIARAIEGQIGLIPSTFLSVQLATRISKKRGKNAIGEWMCSDVVQLSKKIQCISKTGPSDSYPARLIMSWLNLKDVVRWLKAPT
jgi:hypothetical protein